MSKFIKLTLDEMFEFPKFQLQNNQNFTQRFDLPYPECYIKYDNKLKKGYLVEFSILRLAQISSDEILYTWNISVLIESGDLLFFNNPKNVWFVKNWSDLSKELYEPG